MIILAKLNTQNEVNRINAKLKSVGCSMTATFEQRFYKNTSRYVLGLENSMRSIALIPNQTMCIVTSQTVHLVSCADEYYRGQYAW